MNTTETKETCPRCGSENWAIPADGPVREGGWHGGCRFEWGRYAGVHMVRLTAKRCGDCGQVESVDPEWD